MEGTAVPVRSEVDDRQIKLMAALAKFQGSISSAPKTDSALVTMKSGGTYTYSYTPLDVLWDHVRQPLANNGLSVIQTTHPKAEGGVFLTTTLFHEAGGHLASVLVVPPIANPQEFGSMIQYLRRYSFSLILGLTSKEDDDGNRAAGTKATTGRRPDARQAGNTGAGQRGPGPGAQAAAAAPAGTGSAAPPPAHQAPPAAQNAAPAGKDPDDAYDTHDPADMKRPHPQATNPDAITMARLKRLFALAGSRWTKDDIRAYLADHFTTKGGGPIEHIYDLGYRDYEAACSFIEQNTPGRG